MMVAHDRSMVASSKDIDTFMFIQGMLEGNGLIAPTFNLYVRGQSKSDLVMDSPALGRGVLDRAAASSSLCSRAIGGVLTTQLDDHAYSARQVI
ncbi:S2-RNase [Pyrus ussuriensis x Pyrus communis]|uniref:S2-RNase n=1 Tax=Pyrus ussuriensis x Pyrus communis TaxID=2448454 RepID=A0A5N5FNS5_9ROSA|nr:S2-RNase [Pyrus ussuriensis x Pyrus communis]KAB2634403.1 S2-RNase [Pyrus ussuriensis x Pyrus communis]